MKFFISLVISFSILLLSSCKDSAKQEKVTQEALREVEIASEDMKQEFLKQLDKEGALSIESGPDISKIQASLEKASHKLSGQDAIVMDLAKWFVQKMASVQKKMQDASVEFYSATDYSNVKTTDDMDTLSERVKKLG